MAVHRDNPYPNYNFLVEIDGLDTQGAFMEVELPDVRVDVIEYRTGSYRSSAVHKLPGRASYSDVTLRRGVIGALDLYSWLDQTIQGDPGARRAMSVILLDEARQEVLRWNFQNVFPTEYQFNKLDATGKTVLVESLTLAVERMELV